MESTLLSKLSGLRLLVSAPTSFGGSKKDIKSRFAFRLDIANFLNFTLVALLWDTRNKEFLQEDHIKFQRKIKS